MQPIAITLALAALTSTALAGADKKVKPPNVPQPPHPVITVPVESIALPIQSVAVPVESIIVPAINPAPIPVPAVPVPVAPIH
ncbi:hypothetical protein COCCADRAFT_96263 [Bipolaris zeicola 26-R-13]|uniref:Uncharacterized protein n=1 Tax=Cochliobolus carbonum (strain 26-R-13) TaxID=930089 RepID=W6YCT6_COCC2|nr:uncharacterized protein COCCADRAFT_96263 [Bipolaris zeicola 26-R-13]EUC33339.1 hypothetical protein COCCADRAFT_96263 [Bipolaris zeicola 26-R-13]